MKSSLAILMHLALLASCAQENSPASSTKASAMTQQKVSTEDNQLIAGSENQSSAIEVSTSKVERLTRGDGSTEGLPLLLKKLLSPAHRRYCR